MFWNQCEAGKVNAAMQRFLVGLGMEAHTILSLMKKDRDFASRIAECAKEKCGIPSCRTLGRDTVPPAAKDRISAFWNEVHAEVVGGAVFNFLVALGADASEVLAEMRGNPMLISKITGYAKFQSGLYALTPEEIARRSRVAERTRHSLSKHISACQPIG